MVEIGDVLNQEGRPITYFSEKLSDAWKKFPTNVKVFYATVRALKHWQRHYLIGGDFILHLGHRALKFIQGQYKLNSRLANWAKYLQSVHFIIYHTSEKLNKVVNALFRR